MIDLNHKVDERLASWKILLPIQTNSKTLIIGGTLGIVKSLSRSLKIIYWLQTENSFPGFLENLPDNVSIIHDTNQIKTLFDIIVVADASFKLSVIKTFRKQCLKENGALVLVGLDENLKGWGSRWCVTLNYEHYLFLSALPAHTPRLFFPISPPKFCLAALSFHIPGSKKVRIGLNVLKFLFSCGVSTPLKRRGVIIYSNTKMAEMKGTLASFLSEKMSLNVQNVAIYCGSSSKRRKITLLIECTVANKSSLFVVKVADTSDGADAIHRESRALHHLKKFKVDFFYPSIFLEDEWNNYFIQVQEAFNPNLSHAGCSLSDEHLKVLTFFANMNRKFMPISCTKEWQEINEALNRNPTIFPKELITFWDHYKQNVIEQDKVEIPVHLVHGDFTSWNMRLKNGRLAIFDWEDCLQEGVPFFDLFRFIYRQASLIGPWPGGKKIYNLLVEKLDFLTKMANYESTLWKTIFPLLLMYEYMQRPHKHITELAALHSQYV